MESKNSYIYKYKYTTQKEYKDIHDHYIQLKQDIVKDNYFEGFVSIITLSFAGLYMGFYIKLLLLNSKESNNIPIIMYLFDIRIVLILFILTAVIYRGIVSIKFHKLYFHIYKNQDTLKRLEYLYSNISNEIHKKVKIPKNTLHLQDNKDMVCISSFKYVFPIIIYSFYKDKKIDIIEDILIPLNIFKLYGNTEYFNKLLLYYCKDIATLTELFNSNKSYYEEELSKFYKKEIHICEDNLNIDYLSENDVIKQFHYLSLDLLK